MKVELYLKNLKIESVRKWEKVREKRGKERNEERKIERKLVLTIWNSTHNNNWAWCSVFIVHNNHNYLINLQHHTYLNP